MSEAHDPRALLRSLERKAQKRFGQHFLARPSVVERMVRAARVGPGDRVLEVGPGLGILTEALLGAGAALTAVEIDDTLYERLVEVYPTATVLHADATEVDWSEVCPGDGWKVVANLPYNVGTHLVMAWVRQPRRFPSITVMLQAEVVERMAATPGGKAYGALTVQLQARADVRAVIGIPPEAFVPPPKVHSTVVHVAPHPEPDLGGLPPRVFDRVVAAAFSQRRKVLPNSLGALYGRDRAREALRAVGVPETARAEELGVDAFRGLARALEGAADGQPGDGPGSPPAPR